MKFIPLLAFIVLLFTSCNQSKSVLIASPDQQLITEFSLDKNGIPTYSIQRITPDAPTQVLEPSKLGLIRADLSFDDSLKLEEVIVRGTVSGDYRLTHGKRQEIHWEARETELVLTGPTGEQMNLIFRVFNEAVAFRYLFPDEQIRELEVTGELTSFNLPDSGACWVQPYDIVGHATPAYETYYTRGAPIGTTAPEQSNGWSYPAAFLTGNNWTLISESNLDGTYPGTHLEGLCPDGEYSVAWPASDEMFGEGITHARFTTPFASPWRVIVTGTSPGVLLENTVITDLASPSKIEDTSWIIPGRSAWSWWSDSPSPLYVARQNKFTDLAVAMGWEYNLIDANWNKMIDGTVEQAIYYAIQNGIGPILWYNSGGDHNTVTEAPRDRMLNPVARAREFEWLKKVGVSGVKVDFFHSDKQKLINLYLDILEEASKHQIMVNFHGCTLPRGWERTWPNLMTMEAVKGGEQYKFDSLFTMNAPWHNTILPFTRNAVGPMDYTPVLFTDHRFPHITTYGHELATSVIFESGIVHMADKAEAYLELPPEVRSFLSHVPAAWDDTQYIGGIPGEYVILARRKGADWYLSGINGMNLEFERDIPLEFLAEEMYEALIINDGEEPRSFAISNEALSRDDLLKTDMQGYGGFVVKFTPVKP